MGLGSQPLLCSHVLGLPSRLQGGCFKKIIVVIQETYFYVLLSTKKKQRKLFAAFLALPFQDPTDISSQFHVIFPLNVIWIPGSPLTNGRVKRWWMSQPARCFPPTHTHTQYQLCHLGHGEVSLAASGGSRPKWADSFQSFTRCQRGALCFAVQASLPHRVPVWGGWARSDGERQAFCSSFGSRHRLCLEWQLQNGVSTQGPNLQP